MIFIKKHQEPRWLKNERKKGVTYASLRSQKKRKLRNYLLKEQGYICCFCGIRLGLKQGSSIVPVQYFEAKDKHNTRIAHLLPQSKAPQRTLSYKNMMLSCDSQDEQFPHCDEAQKDQILPITPLQKDCLSFFIFSLDGAILPNPQKNNQDQQRAQETIDILKLNSPMLKQRRGDILSTIGDLIQQNQDVSFLHKKNSRNNSFCEFYFVPIVYFNITE